ncbi:membrane-spanning 4-domains subfamily A member 4A-like isoform X2 [Mixophyes fleayi]|uniref:membrane-spanning 4-domains subfamily A member 4A-like isoform X2 n=1 Tax=Mixophyes fleayi TaxID=3061075 RepID=UPI003F4D7E73
MDLPNIPSFGPFPVTQQHRNILPVVPYAGQEFYKIFLRGQPKVLGVVQITLVSLQLSLGAILTHFLNDSMSITALSCITYWASVLYLISGVLSVSAEIKPSLIRVKGSMAFSIISCLASFIEFCLICYDFAHHYYSSDNWYIYPAIDISYAFLFLATVVQLSISVSLSIFGWKSLNQNFDYVPQDTIFT